MSAPLRTLVLAGGGAKGAYQAAAVHALMREGGYAWADVFGVSVGALNAAAVATGQADGLLELWRGIRASRVYDVAPAAKVALRVLTGADGLYDNHRLRELIGEFVQGHRLRLPCYVGRVNMDTGAFELIARASGEVADADFCDAVWASATMPVVWETARAHGSDVPYGDGGMRDVIPLGDALARGACHDVVVVLCNPREPRFSPLPERRHVWDTAARALDILESENSWRDVEEWERINALVEQAAVLGFRLKKDDGNPYRHVPIRVLAPAEPLGDTLDFSVGAAERRIALGAHDALAFLANGKGTS